MILKHSKFSFKTFLLLIAAGVISTLIMDLGSGLFRALGITSGTPPELTGKWIESAFNGRFFVDDIHTSEGATVPLSRFLFYHYMIGIVLTFVFYFLLNVSKIKNLRWWMPVFYGLSTTIIPAFLMFPGMGFGILGLRGPAEYMLLPTAIVNHLFYGIGILIAFQLLFKSRRAKVVLAEDGSLI